MTALTIREVPEDIASRLKIRAAEADQSLQAYLLALVTREATLPTLAETAQRAEQYAASEIDNDDVLALVDEARVARRLSPTAPPSSCS